MIFCQVGVVTLLNSLQYAKEGKLLFIMLFRSIVMPGKRITLTKANAMWLISHVGNDEYASKSELLANNKKNQSKINPKLIQN